MLAQYSVDDRGSAMWFPDSMRQTYDGSIMRSLPMISATRRDLWAARRNLSGNRKHASVCPLSAAHAFLCVFARVCVCFLFQFLLLK